MIAPAIALAVLTLRLALLALGLLVSPNRLLVSVGPAIIVAIAATALLISNRLAKRR